MGLSADMRRRIGAGFFLLLAAAMTAWWILLLAVPAAREPFVADGAPVSTLFALAPADLLVLVGGSVLAASGLSRVRPWTPVAIAADLGALAYSTAYAVSLAVAEPETWLGGVLMSAALAGAVVVAAITLPVFAQRR